MRKIYFIFVLVFLVAVLMSLSLQTVAIGADIYISHDKTKNYLPLIIDGNPTDLFICSDDFDGVKKVGEHLQNDIFNVCGKKPQLLIDTNLPQRKNIVIVGTIGKNKWIDKLIAEKKIDVSKTINQWETFTIQTIEKPFDGIDRAVIIAGSDKRGTIYGMYDIAEQIGVSPWYWWADVPVAKSDNVFIVPGSHTAGTPKVKYRGIFLNDEAPALSGWAEKTFGGFNAQFYEKIYELILRLKGNYLWPAMWGRSLFDDDPASDDLADMYGIVLGTSHHEPLMRAHVEWARYGNKVWNYEKNQDSLQKFWRDGIQRMGNKESIVTVGMRGDGDEPMTDGTAISLLEKIVADQRTIIEQETGKPANQTPQMWALYKEVQDYYDDGMRVPDDVTLLLCDDNWGNIRKLPVYGDTLRKGGYGIYYHFDYVGGPRNYKWLNTNQVSRVWEQMNLAYNYGVDNIWIVNVGDLKPMELPISFFLDFAWNPTAWTADNIQEYSVLWAAQQFPGENAEAIAEMLNQYTRFNARRKPELLSSKTYNLVNYREFETIVNEYNELENKARKLYESIDANKKDAFYQLVYHPIQACANLNELYYAHALNQYYAAQKRASANDMAQKVKDLFTKDADITNHYHNINGGKWEHFMAQTHIGYTSWQEPRTNIMPVVNEITLPEKSQMNATVEGAELSLKETQNVAKLPLFDSYNKQNFYIELFNTGKSTTKFKISPSEKWIILTEKKGTIDKQKRIEVSIDWSKIPAKVNKATLAVTSNVGDKYTINIEAEKFETEVPKRNRTHVERNGYVCIEPENFSKANKNNNVDWVIIPEFGRTKSGVTSQPVYKNFETVDGSNPSLEYNFYLTSMPNDSTITANIYIAPTLNFHSKSLRFAVAIDDQTPQIVDIQTNKRGEWDESVRNNSYILKTKHKISAKGSRTLKYYLLDGGVVLQRIIIDNGGLRSHYLGPKESLFVK